MSDERVDPPYSADERTMLEAWLDWHRGTLATKFAGLTAEQLRSRSVEPSSLSLLGLVRHMADVERGWFGRCLGGEELRPIYSSKEDPDGDFDNVEDADPDEDMAVWHTECARSRTVLAKIGSLDETGTTRRGINVSARWVLVHMIEEYARHNGHADFLRERIDGVTGD
jgi:uncharacterized damage-inducible protein DinB